MNVLRAITEFLLGIVLHAARAAFMAQALALGVALFFSSSFSDGAYRPWVAIAVGPLAVIAGTFAIGAILLHVASFLAPRGAPIGGRPREESAVDRDPASPAPIEVEATTTLGALRLLPLSLIVIPLLTVFLSTHLFGLWREIVDALRRFGMLDARAMSDPMSGYAFAPVLVAVYLPALEAASVAFLAIVPPLTLPSLMTRSRRFPAIYLKLVIAQSALVVASFVGARLFSSLATRLVPVLTADHGREGAMVVERMGHAQTVLTSTALALWLPLLAFAARTPVVLRSWSRERSDADATEEPAVLSRLPAAARRDLERTIHDARTRQSGRADSARSAAGASASARLAGGALVTVGVLMLVFGGCQSLAPRARFVRSVPTPGARLDAAPREIRLQFDRPMQDRSSISVTRTASHPAAEHPQPATTSGGLDPRDDHRSTLVSRLPAGDAGGVYRVDWRAFPVERGVTRYGTYYFGVGMVASEGARVRERDAGERDHRSVLVGGVLMILVGAILPIWSRRPTTRTR